MSEPDCDRRAHCAIAVMAKASIPGRAKTRLSPPLTPAQAADLNTAFLRDIANNLLQAGHQVFIRPHMAFAPAGSEAFFNRILPAGIDLVETVAPRFGDCLLRATQTMLGRGYGAACVLNSDSPTLPASYLVAAVTALAAEGDRAVIGPSTDGGYYLLGMKRAHRHLFDDIEWSTERVFEQTLARAREIELPMVVLPTWYDVDDAAALRMLVGELLEGRVFRAVGPRRPAAVHSRRALIELLQASEIASALGVAPVLTHVA
jgi:rSAM/selenodomain-associated transferase 1